MKLRTEFEMAIDVDFAEPEKAKSFFIDGDWKESFFTFDDMEELAAALAFSLHNYPEQWDSDLKTFVRSPEGYGTFMLSGDNDKWTNIEAAQREVGLITIRYDMELEPVGTYAA